MSLDSGHFRIGRGKSIARSNWRRNLADEARPFARGPDFGYDKYGGYPADKAKGLDFSGSSKSGANGGLWILMGIRSSRPASMAHREIWDGPVARRRHRHPSADAIALTNLRLKGWGMTTGGRGTAERGYASLEHECQNHFSRHAGCVFAMSLQK